MVRADIRTTSIKGSPSKARLVGGRNARLARWPTGTTRLDRDTQLVYDLALITFAEELPAVLDGFANGISECRDQFRQATQQLLRTTVE